MAERVPWWRAFLVKRKTVPKDTTASQTQEQEPINPQEGSASAPEAPGDRAQPQTNLPEELSSSSLFTDETFDDSRLEPVFNEQTCRRHMRVSRSGRFKEKRRVRSSLPLEDEEKEKDKGKEDVR